MNRERALRLLRAVAAGEVSSEAALQELSHAPVAELADATLDMHRALRQGFPEVVLAEGKSLGQTCGIVSRLAEAGQGVLVTRASEAQRSALTAAHPDAESNELARTIWIPSRDPISQVEDFVMVMTAGTSDLPVAEEAIVTLRVHGVPVESVADVGVAGIHRLTPHLATMSRAVAVIVVAGMDGALASVVGGLARVPVIAVPTSVGYGASLGGVAALLSMLNSCAAGLTVVNIDNGFGAGVAASRIARAVHHARGQGVDVLPRQGVTAMPSSGVQGVSPA